MKSWISYFAVLLACVAVPATASSAVQAQNGAPDGEARRVWTDPSTGLMWAGKDNGTGVSWKSAVKYCRDLRLRGYSNWRLATRAELRAIYDPNSSARGLAGVDREPSTWHVRGNLFLTGDEWSSERRYDDRGRPDGYSWYFDFNDGKSNDDPTGFPYPHSLRRALCVRGSQK